MVMGKDVIFLGQKEPKDSYQDLFRMVDLSGFSIQDQSGVGPEDAHYIRCSHCDVCAGVGKEEIYWYLERPLHDGGILGLKSRFTGYLKDNTYKEIWVSDRRMAEELGNIVKFVPIGSMEGLSYMNEDKKYDVVHFSFETARRVPIYKGVGGTIAPNVYGDPKYGIVSESKFLLNVHQSNDFYIEPLRFSLAVSAGIPIISEINYDPYPYGNNKGFIEFPYEKLIDSTNSIIKEDYEKYREYGLSLRDKILRDYRFKENVLRALSA